MAFNLDAPTVSLLVFGVAFAALQVWWIGALLVRNRRHRGERPLSSDVAVILNVSFVRSPESTLGYVRSVRVVHPRRRPFAPLARAMDAEHQRRYAPRELICPGEPVALRRDQAGPEAALMLWGLIPSWSGSHPGTKTHQRRSETVAEKASFRGAWRHRRCLIPPVLFWRRAADSGVSTVSRSGWLGFGALARQRWQ